MNENYSIEEQINDIRCRKPHLVILGAGASRAVCPNGDKNGLQLPLMNDLIETLKLDKLIQNYGFNLLDNFESFYSQIHDRDKKLAKEIEEKIYNYFSLIEIPDKPTLYDHLALSLREKDVIATFNWDPLLYQAMERNTPYLRNTFGYIPYLGSTFGYIPYPRVLYLHGNVIVGYCINKCSSGKVGQKCWKCKAPYEKSKLLYPIHEKNYNSDQFIEYQWQSVKHTLSKAFCVTVFGYSKPTLDKEAIDLFKEGWGSSKERQFEEFEIIDIIGKEQASNNWKDFIHTHHYRYTENFYESLIARHPRRSCEILYTTYMENRWLGDHRPIKQYNSFKELYNFLNPLIYKEKEFYNKKI